MSVYSVVPSSEVFVRVGACSREIENICVMGVNI